jgi:hypothetical protein
LRTISIPTVDISTDTTRQVVIARGTEKEYQGHCDTVLMDWSSSVVRRGGRREVNLGLVLIPTLDPVFCGIVFVFHHGQFGARRDANIGMRPEVPPPERM